MTYQQISHDNAATAPRGSDTGGPRASAGDGMAETGNVRAPLSIRFVVPGQPQGKGRPRVATRGGHASMYTPAKTAAYEGLIAHAAHVSMAGRDMLLGPVLVNLFIGCQIPASWSQKKQRQALAGEILPTTKPDKDNVVKAVFDGCNGVAWKDDVQVTDLNSKKRYTATPRVVVTIIPIVLGPEQSTLGDAS